MTTTVPATQQTVRGAVASRQQQNAIDPWSALRQAMKAAAPIINNLLPTDSRQAKFMSIIANAVRATPKLIACDPDTIVAAALRSATLNLEPNDTRNQCWILPYGSEASWQLGYGGVLELARRAVPGLQVQGHAVYPNDEFDIEYGADRPLTHRPAVVRALPRGGDAFAWYVLLRYPDGRQFVHVLDREGVEYHHGFSKQPQGLMWTKSYDAAALKSVVLDMKRWLPQSTEMAKAFAHDETVARVKDLEREKEIEADPFTSDAPALPPAGVDEDGVVQ